MKKIPFLITIDTEGDNLWGDAPVITTKNAHYLPRFQELCEQYNFKPSYLTNYEMAIDPTYQVFAKNVISRNTGEVGMHLHAWNSPPLSPLIGGDPAGKAYLIEFPEAVIREKAEYMTSLLEDTFGVKMLSHRAGRWAFDTRYARILRELGYRVDCSVTPHVDWRQTRGAISGGTNYSAFQENAYFMDSDDISKPGDSSLLQVPMSITRKYPAWVDALKGGIHTLRGKQKSPSLQWLRPRGGNAKGMIAAAEFALKSRKTHVEFMLHSSEFMPGGSPTFKDEEAIEQLYVDLETLFKFLRNYCKGQTLAEFHSDFSISNRQ
ncbi:deacetylase [Aquitalea sp. S1-19]|nr:deacetylase [Aquitalea sp. S1-19]